MKGKGYTVVLDAVVALALTLIIFGAIFRIGFSQETSSMSFKNIHYVSEDVLDALNKQGVLDQIGEEWAGNTSGNNATELARPYLEKLIPGSIGYRLEIIEKGTNYTIAENTTRVPESGVVAKTHSTRLLVGYGAGLPTRGYVARSYVTGIREKITSSYAYFGGLAGRGNLTVLVGNIPSDATVRQACLELNAGDEFDLSVNGNAPHHFSPSSDGMGANVDECIPTPEDEFLPGDNLIDIEFTGDDMNKHYIGGGYISVIFNTSEMDTEPVTKTKRYRFPGIEGFIDLYDSFYVPGDLNNVEAHIHLQSNYSTYLRIGDTVILNTTANETAQTVDITNETFSGLLDYDAMGQETVPLRFGTGNQTEAVTKSYLFNDSYIEFTFAPLNVSGYGEISLTSAKEISLTWSTEPFNNTDNCTGTLNVLPETRVSDAKVTSYSGEHWTDLASVGSDGAFEVVYSLADYGSDYTLLGDPYIVNIPVDLIPSGKSTDVMVMTGDSPAVRTNCSDDDRLIYTLRMQNLVSYGNVFLERLGCNWTVEFEDGTGISETIAIDGYTGDETCSYSDSAMSYDEDDAIDDAVFRLMDHLDLDNDGRVDFTFDSDMVNVEFSSAGGVQSLWGPVEFKLIMWM